MAESKALIVKDDVFALAAKHDEALEKIEDAVDACQLYCEDGEKKAFKKAFVLAKSLQMLQALVTDDMMDVICQLQDNPLGFRTDKDPKQYDSKTQKPNVPYPKAVVKSCFIEATLRGARPIGNEFNIIAARPYLTKEYFERKVKEFKGLTNFSSKPGVPHMGNDGALVPYSATWLRDGKPERLERTLRKEDNGQVSDERIPVRVNAQMGADAILGKARRKFLAAVYGQLTGSEFLMLPEGEVEDGDTTGGGGTTASGFRRPSLPPQTLTIPASSAATTDDSMNPAKEWIDAIRKATTIEELKDVRNRLFEAHPEASDPMRSAVAQAYSEAHMELVDIKTETR